MDYQELKEQIAAVPASKAKDYRELLAMSGVAGNVWPELREHLAAASTCDEFYELVYNDDACRYNNVWAMWAKMKKKKWLDRFEADEVLHNKLLDDRGIFLQSSDGSEILIPMTGRGLSCDIYVFKENGFNEKAADLFCSIYGKHTCCGVELDGAYDIYRTNRALIFEKWEIDKFMRRANGKGQMRTGVDCAAVW